MPPGANGISTCLIRKATNCRLPGRYNDWEKVRSGGTADVCIYGDVPLIQ
jgi:hypothetical protein